MSNEYQVGFFFRGPDGKPGGIKITVHCNYKWEAWKIAEISFRKDHPENAYTIVLRQLLES